MSKKKKSKEPPKPVISRSPHFRTVYATGATGHFSPFDYRLAFYNHESQFPEKPTEALRVPISQVFQIEIIMSTDLLKRLRDMLDRQLKEREKATKPKQEGT